MRLLRLAYSLIFLLLTAGLSAQNTEQKDSLVRLLGCDELQQVEEYGTSYRKALGHARFEHNSTMLICDTALWNVNLNVINAFGNVKIIQNNTVLSSESLDYYIDDNLAEFRGALVQLQDKDRNTLRTNNLDYNTKDSVAVFRGGASLRDKDGQIIESDQGSYDSKIKTFTFSDNVNMYTDSIFVKTDDLTYNTGTNIALFGTRTNAWKDDNMLSSMAGMYERNIEKFTFTRNVHLLTEDQEAWADTLVYFRMSNDAEMSGNVELLDTTRNVAAVAGYMQYVDSISCIRLARDPAVIAISEEGEKRDTVYIGADTLVLRSIPRCDVDSVEVVNSAARVKELSADAVTEYRRKAAEAAKAAAEAAKKKLAEEDPNSAGTKDKGAAAAASGAAKTAAGDGKAHKSKAGKASVDKSGVAASASTASAAPPLGRAKPHLPAPYDDFDEYVLPVWSAVPEVSDVPEYAAKSAPQDTLKRTALGTAKTAPQDTLKKTAVSSAEAPQDTLSKDKSRPGFPDSNAQPDPLTLQDSLTASSPDSLGVEGADSLAVADSLAAAPKDTTKISFIYGLHNVRVFRSDMQVVCDSLAYNDLDSLVRLYKRPLVWNEIKRQYTADSITVIVKNQALERASLMSNAFIVVQEDSLCYDQIRGTEMMAYFDSTGTLKRFDALGGASGLFFIEENGSLATVNKFESKMLTATLSGGEIQDLNYFESVKSDAYPVVQMTEDEKILKGFEWQPDKRPKGPEDVTAYKPRKSERQRYEDVPRAGFQHTDTYFPGYMDGVYRLIEVRDSIKLARKTERERLEEERKAREARLADSLKLAASADSLAAVRDSIAQKAAADSIAAFKADSLAKAASVPSVKDSLAMARDSIAAARADSLSRDPEYIKKLNKEKKEAEKARKKAAREQARKDRIAAKEARWAELDARDSAKAKAKEEKALKKKRKKTLKTLRAMEERRKKEERLIDGYKSRFEKRKARRSGAVPAAKTDVPAKVQTNPTNVQTDSSNVKAEVQTEA